MKYRIEYKIHELNIATFRLPYASVSKRVLVQNIVYDKQIDVSFSCVCPVIDHESHHNIVKVAVDPQNDSRVDRQTTLTMLCRNSLSLTGQTHKKLTSICFLR